MYEGAEIEMAVSSMDYYFGLYETREIDSTKRLMTTLWRIVIKNKLGIIEKKGFTGLEAFVHPYVGTDVISEDGHNKQKLLMVCQALNYFVEHGVKKLLDIDKRLTFDFFDFYRRKSIANNNEHHVNQATLDLCVKTVSAFLANLGEAGMVNIEPAEIMRPEYVRLPKSHREKMIYVPVYKTRALDSAPSMLLRQMPDKVLDMLIDVAKAYDPMIKFAIILQSKAGLRESEAMNVRQADSPLSATPGISISMYGSQVKSIEIDLTREYLLRSDGMNVGRIKRDTNHLTEVYPKNNLAVYAAYQEHMELLRSTPFEEQYKPMFVDRNGRAMTARAYCARFGKLVMTRMRPLLLESNDPELSAFGQMLLTYKLPPHVLRHYFTVRLVQDGLSVGEVMHYRGDRSEDSALAYLRNKGILVEQLEKYHTIVIEGLTNVGPNYLT